MEKDKSLPISDDTYLKYKKHLDTISSMIGNKYIYDIFYEHTFKNKQFDESINSYEACFISQIIKAYVSQYKKKAPIQMVDVGTGQGISSIVILNELLNVSGVSYTSIDPDQSDKWQNMGQTNILQFLKYMNSSNITPKFMEQPSDTLLSDMVKEKEKVNILYLNDTNKETLVQDIKHSNSLLVKHGILIIPNVNLPHIKEIVATLTDYNRISIESSTIKIEKELVLDIENPDSITNSSTIYCFQKIN